MYKSQFTDPIKFKICEKFIARIKNIKHTREKTKLNKNMTENPPYRTQKRDNLKASHFVSSSQNLSPQIIFLANDVVVQSCF